jgi:uncharacterized protein (DUF1501 family)
MKMTRREFMRGGAAAFTVGFRAPAFLCDLARAQGVSGRSLVVLNLSGGNDALSTLVPYQDSFYYSRRPSQAVPASSVLQIGSDASGKALGLHPNLAGLKSMYDEGRLALVQRTGYENSSRSHFKGTDIWSTANPNSVFGPGWLGRYLDTLPSPVDPLVAWNTAGALPHSLLATTVGVPSIPNPSQYVFSSPNTGAEAQYSRDAAVRMSSHLPVTQPHLSFVNSTSQAALATLDRVAQVAQYSPSVAYPNDGFGLALRAVAGALIRGVGTKIFWVQTGGYDTHASQDTNTGNYSRLMTTLNDGLAAFYTDLKTQGLLGETLVLQFSEFGRRIAENGSRGTDHGAGGLMLAIGGGVRGGIYGTAASLNPTPDNPGLENNGNDVRFETDFRSVYARVIDDWLGADSVSLLGANFRNATVDFV